MARNETEVFIASCMTSLEDLLKTSIAKNKSIHCQFPRSSLEFDALLLNQCKRKGIVKITFSNGIEIPLQNSSNDDQY